MSHFNIDRPRTLSGEAARALMARMYNLDLEHDPDRPDFYRLESSDIEALFHLLGQVDAERAMRRAGFIPMQPGFWVTRFRTEKGGDKVQRLFPPYDLLHAIARTYGREDHALSLSVSAGAASCLFAESGSE